MIHKLSIFRYEITPYLYSFVSLSLVLHIFSKYAYNYTTHNTYYYYNEWYYFIIPALTVHYLSTEKQIVHKLGFWNYTSLIYSEHRMCYHSCIGLQSL